MFSTMHYQSWAHSPHVCGTLIVEHTRWEGSKTKIVPNHGSRSYISKGLRNCDFRQNNMGVIYPSYSFYCCNARPASEHHSSMFVVGLWLHVVNKETAKYCCFVTDCCCGTYIQQYANVVLYVAIWWFLFFTATILPSKFKEHQHK